MSFPRATKTATSVSLAGWLCALVCFLPVCCHAAAADEKTSVKPEERATVIIVVGAEGEETYGQAFARWALHWNQICQTGNVNRITVGLADGPGDRERLQKELEVQPKTNAAPLWLVLLGHGTYDGKEARFNLRGPDVTATDLATWLKPFQRPLAIVNAASASAPFVNKLSAPGRVVITATRSGAEQNLTRFGEYFSGAFLNLQADLDKDGQVSLLEGFLFAGTQVNEFYKAEGRLATEHALLDDNGDSLGTPAEWFRGVRAIKKPDKGASVDGYRAHQLHLIPSAEERRLPAAIRARRDELELQMIKLRESKDTQPADAYYKQVEDLGRALAKIYEEAGAFK